MNFKRNWLFITTALVGALALSGCDIGKLSKFEHFEYIDKVEDYKESIEASGYTKFSEYDNYVAINSLSEEKDLGQAYDVFKNCGGASNIPSTGEQKIIVVPVIFSDYGLDKLKVSGETYIENLKKAFFGSPKNNDYVSVGQYFNLSSYGKLRLDGKVCNKFFKFPLSVSTIKEMKLSKYDLASFYGDVISWYKENYDDIDDYRVKGLKTDYDVPIYMVYCHPSEEQTQDDLENFFWAYTFSNVPLSWSSYSFMNTQYGEPDAHTYIHETGHLLGLTDYYPTIAPANKEIEVIEPTSRIDMMDCSIGDETSFSKMYLNWTRPYYAYDDCTLKIRSFTDYGDVILLSNNWNKTIFDEYYLIELYTPTGLNTHDVSVGNSEAKLPKVPGIKIYHVDARLAYFSGIGTTSKTIISYCNEGGADPLTNNVGFAHDNNTYESPDIYEQNYFYQLILNHSKKTQNFCATDANLFRAGDEIPELTFNNGEVLNFKINIESLEFSNATIKIEKNA